MSTVVAVVIGVAAALAVALVLVLRGRGPGRVARVLRVAAAVATLAVAAVVVWPAWQDGGGFAVVLVGVPLLCAAGALAVPLGGPVGAAMTWGAAVVMLGWSLLTGLGLGGYFLGPSVLMVAAAVAATPGAGSARTSAVTSTPRAGSGRNGSPAGARAEPGL